MMEYPDRQRLADAAPCIDQGRSNYQASGRTRIHPRHLSFASWNNCPTHQGIRHWTLIQAISFPFYFLGKQTFSHKNRITAKYIVIQIILCRSEKSRDHFINQNSYNIHHYHFCRKNHGQAADKRIANDRISGNASNLWPCRDSHAGQRTAPFKRTYTHFCACCMRNYCVCADVKKRKISRRRDAEAGTMTASKEKGRGPQGPRPDADRRNVQYLRTSGPGADMAIGAMPVSPNM